MRDAGQILGHPRCLSPSHPTVIRGADTSSACSRSCRRRPSLSHNANTCREVTETERSVEPNMSHDTMLFYLVAIQSLPTRRRASIAGRECGGPRFRLCPALRPRGPARPPGCPRASCQRSAKRSHDSRSGHADRSGAHQTIGITGPFLRHAMHTRSPTAFYARLAKADGGGGLYLGDMAAGRTRPDYVRPERHAPGHGRVSACPRRPNCR